MWSRCQTFLRHALVSVCNSWHRDSVSELFRFLARWRFVLLTPATAQSLRLRPCDFNHRDFGRSADCVRFDSPIKRKAYLSSRIGLVVKLFLFPSYAAPDPRHENAWRVRVSGACLKAKTQKLRRKVLLNILRRLTDLSEEELHSELCRQRGEPFFLAGSRKSRILFEIDGQPIAKMKKTKRNGQFRAKFLVKNSELSADVSESRFIELSARDEESNVEAGKLRIPLIAEEGKSIISDIDDTIKFSNVENRAELLANTFARPFETVAGMAELFQQFQKSDGYEYHYVTASPWQLYEPLYEFLCDNGFPAGSMHFRTFRVSDHLLKRLGVIHRSGKAAAVRRILGSFPKREFTLIGDSGEKDIEIYARCYQQFPDRVKRVLIRLVKPEHVHRESVIEGRLLLPESVFQVYETADELAKILRDSD